MNSFQVKKLLEDNKINELYKSFEKAFELVDTWAERFTEGDLLTEYELAHSMDQLSGVYAKLNPVAGALESLLLETEYDTEVKEYDTLEKGEGVKTKDSSIVKAKARNSVASLRRFTADFSRYCQSANSLIITAQSRLKRLTVEKSAKRLDYTGERPLEQNTPVENKESKIDGTGW